MEMFVLSVVSQWSQQQMEKADSKSQLRRRESVSKVLPSPAWPSKPLATTATARFWCPNTNRGAVSHNNHTMGCTSSEKSPNFCNIHNCRCVVSVHFSAFLKNWFVLVGENRNETLVSVWPQTGGSAGSPCGAALRRGSRAKRDGRSWNLQDFRDHQWNQGTQICVWWQ